MLYKFRGVEFNVEKITYGRGQKPKESDFLGGDSLDQGTVLDNIDFQVQGYIYGRRVEETKIKLERALEKQRGLLVMHDGRSAQVKVEDGWHIAKDETTDDKYNIEMSFKKIDRDSLSLKIIELQELDDEKLKKAITEAEKSFLQEFDEKFTFEGFPGFVKLQSFENLVSITNKISKLTADNLIGQFTNPISGSLEILAAVAGGISSTILSYTKLREIFGNLFGKDYFDAYISMAGISSGVKKPDFSADATDQIYQNANAAEQLINQEAVIEAVNEAVYNKEYANAGELTETIDTLINTSLNVAYDTDNKTIQNHINSILNIGIGLIKQKHTVAITTKSYNKSLPACVIAYNLYGSDNLESRAAGLQKRNKVANPLFMPAGSKLEVEVL